MVFLCSHDVERTTDRRAGLVLTGNSAALHVEILARSNLRLLWMIWSKHFTALRFFSARAVCDHSVASLMAALEKATGGGEGVSTTALEYSTMPTSEEATSSSSLPPSGVATSSALSGPGRCDDGEAPGTIGVSGGIFFGEGVAAVA